MTNRIKGCTVVFERDIREDDAEAVLNAIRMVRGVLSVNPSLSTHEDWMAQERVKQEIGWKLWEILYSKNKS